MWFTNFKFKTFCVCYELISPGKVISYCLRNLYTGHKKTLLVLIQLQLMIYAMLFQVLVLRELAVSAPTFFFQQVQPFFDNIFNAVRDPKQAIREGAVAALRACLVLTSQRETKEMQKPQWYRVSLTGV